MPRQDVPYGGAICRLKERIAEIWDELGKKLHSINGVEGDAAGDVKIVSGDAAVVVTSDQVNHEIEIALDSSQLPAASVSSVNGQTGAVVLDASDINVIGGSDVATDLGNLDADLQQVQTDIATEALARANADSALQGNINAAVASIPGAAATAVANDPTVAQLATDVPNKVDKITSGSSLKAYTHTGATQGETSVVDGTAANSIGIRNANGRMQAADPASGATDKTLVTANWVSQTGDSAPNNLIHKSGNETKNGTLALNNGIKAYPFDWHFTNKTGQALGEYCIFAEIETDYNGRYLIIDFIQSSNTANAYGRLLVRCNKSVPFPMWAFRKTNGSNNPLSSSAIHVISDGTKLYLAWKKETTYGGVVACEVLDISYGAASTIAGSNITWYAPDNRILVGDLSAYTDYQVIE